MTQDIQVHRWRRTTAGVAKIAAKFHLYRDEHGKHRWQLKAGAKTVAQGEPHESREAARDAIQEVKDVAADAAVVVDDD